MKCKINFKIYDVTTWLTKYYNAHIAQYLRNYRQPNNDIWSVDRISQDNYFFLTLCRKGGRESSSRPPFAFLKSFILGKSKWSVA